jgi:hypothetical protein
VANPSNLTHADGVLHRLQTALTALAKTDTSWEQYRDRSDVQTDVQWGKVIVAGHSLVRVSVYFCELQWKCRICPPFWGILMTQGKENRRRALTWRLLSRNDSLLSGSLLSLA